MTVELFYLQGCPHHGAAVDLVRSVLEDEGMPVNVQQILIESADDANAYSFPGSPTIRVNGRDIENIPLHRLAPGVACRTYFVEGNAQGLPPRSWLENAIRMARSQERCR